MYSLVWTLPRSKVESLKRCVTVQQWRIKTLVPPTGRLEALTETVQLDLILPPQKPIGLVSHFTADIIYNLVNLVHFKTGDACLVVNISNSSRLNSHIMHGLWKNICICYSSNRCKGGNASLTTINPKQNVR